jgi:branched-chain amino acid transport system permease protein
MTVSIINGFFVGVIYGLFAAGIVLVYRVDRVLNFAHGSIGMIGTFVFMTWWASEHRPLGLALVGGCAIAMLISTGTAYLVVRPLRGRSPEVPLLATFAVGALLQIYAGRKWGLNPIANPPVVSGVAFQAFGVEILTVQVVGVAVTIFVFLALFVLLNRTNFGLRVRAVALNPEAASQVGIRTNGVSASIWALAGLLAVISGVLISYNGVLRYDFMEPFMLRGLLAALIGGLTSLTGSLAAGILIGVTEGIVGYYYSAPGDVEAILAVVIIALLVARPSGLVRSQY